MDPRTVNLRGIAGSAGNIMQGIGGFVFGKENHATKEDSYVERYLDHISNGVIAEDRRAALTELQSLLAESSSAQMTFGAIGFPVLLNVLKEDRGDVEIVRGALETLVSALTPIESSLGVKSEVLPASINSDLLSRETENVSLILSLLSEDDFYVRYYTIQLLTALMTHSPKRIQEAVLSIPRGITVLMDMLMDREVIRNEALLLLTYLTRDAEEIQKIVVFEGIFEKIFSIIKEEGDSDGGVVVQDCLVLLNNLIRNNASNQILLKETIGFDSLISILKLRRGSAYNFTQQKTVNLLNTLETVELLLKGGQPSEQVKDVTVQSNQSALAQKNILDCLLLLGVESQWAPVSVRCMALRCIGDLVLNNRQNLDVLAAKLVGEEPNVEPALNAILRILLRTSVTQEFLAADYVFKCFCEKNSDGQALLASTMTPHPNQTFQIPFQAAANVPFGSMLLLALISRDNDGDAEANSRAASVLSHILKDNMQCKERALQIKLEAPTPPFGHKEPLLHRIITYLSVDATAAIVDNNPAHSLSQDSHVQPAVLARLLFIWLIDCPAAVDCLLESKGHLNYLIELTSDRQYAPAVRGLTAAILGTCIVYNTSSDKGRDASAVSDVLSKKIGISSYFLTFDDLRKSLVHLSASQQPDHRPLVRLNTAGMEDVEDIEDNANEEADRGDKNPVVAEMFKLQFIQLLSKLEDDVKESIMGIFSGTKGMSAALPSELEQKDGEAEADYIKRLKSFVENQCYEMQELLARNTTLAEEIIKIGGGTTESLKKTSSNGRERVQLEQARRELEQAARQIEALKTDKSKIEAEASNHRNLAMKLESDLKSLSDAYNSLERDNHRLDGEVKALRQSGGGAAHANPDLEAIRAAAKEEAEKENEAELNDLLVCLGQEQSKVEKLSARLAELGEDVDALLRDIADDAGSLQDGEDDDDDDGSHQKR